jgi:hypothetical protein
MKTQVVKNKWLHSFNLEFKIYTIKRDTNLDGLKKIECLSI